MNKILKRKNKKGFTLMEMLIVIGIIAILIAIAIPTFGGAQKKAKYTADVANVRAWYAEVQTELMTDDTKKASSFSFDEDILQFDGAKVYQSGDAAEDFKVTYNPGDTKFETQTFGGDGVELTK